MARAELRLDLKNIEPVRLMVWELMQLRDHMRVTADPNAARLERIIDRFAKGKEDRL